MAGRSFGHDYKMDLLEEEGFRQQSSTTNWIYIGVDTRSSDMAKIGLTTNSLGTRASGSQNPFYTLFCAFKIEEGIGSDVVDCIERAVKRFLGELYECIPHETSGRLSEWFYAPPLEMREYVHNFLYENFSREMHCYHCSIRDVGVIYSWENSRFFPDPMSLRYQSGDLSSPPMDPNCFMPGGCGADCDCWD